MNINKTKSKKNENNYMQLFCEVVNLKKMFLMIWMYNLSSN